MAAVAAEPGAAAVSTPDQDPGPVDPLNPLDLGPGSPALTAPPEAPLEAPGRRESVPTELQETRGEEGRHVGPEPEPAAGTEDPAGNRAGPGRAEPGLPDPQPPAVFPFSVPAPQTHTEPGLSLDEPDTPTTGTTERAEPDRERDYSPEPEPSVKTLSPGTEVRVSLDHVIDDALVVSFRFGEKVFSGVLMDVCKRFGPYGIPITMFPRRDDHSKPQLSVLSPSVANDDHSIKQEEVTPPPHPWTSKPPPLFQEGAPYPPPLFIRDTYNQALPQPLPRKIKRLKRRYRCEEPTSIMNSIKLRPRQVLCDKCKAVVSSSGPRETRRGAVDLRGEEASRRRRAAEGPISSELKRLKSDDKTGRPVADRRPSSTIRVTSSSSSSSTGRMLRGVASASSNRMCLNSKKVLDKRSNVDRSKARQVLNKLTPSPRLASPHRRLKDQNQNQNHGQKHNQERIRAVTRATALQNHNQKVHFTRRLQHHGSTPVSSNSPLPPRMRLKPQRYRTDEGQAPSSSSPPKQITRALPPKPAVSSAPTPVPSAPPPSATTGPPLTCTAVVTQELRPPEEKEVEQEGGGGDQVKVEEPPPPPSSSSSSVDSSHSECSSTETFDLPPPGRPPSTSSSSGPPCPSPSPVAPPLRAGSEETQAVGEEGDEDGGEFKRRRKSSTSSTSSSSSSSSSVFSKLVSKCSLPDGRTVCVGDIVWAKIYGFPWWPARILGITVARRGDTGLAVRQEARVSWFGSPTTSFLPLGQLSPFLESFQSRFDRKRKGPYRRAIAEAASAAKQLTPEVRALLTQFET